MKNEHQENGVRDPLILIVPGSNLVAVMSLGWFDGTDRGAVSAKNHSRSPPGNSAENSERPGRAQPSRFRERVVNADRQLDDLA